MCPGSAPLGTKASVSCRNVLISRAGALSKAVPSGPEHHRLRHRRPVLRHVGCCPGRVEARPYRGEVDGRTAAHLCRKSRKARGDGANRAWARLKVARIHARIAGRRRGSLHKITTRLVRENQTIVIKDLAVRNMVKNGRPARAISDAAWSQFRSMLEDKAHWYGRQVIAVDRWFPSSRRGGGSQDIGPWYDNDNARATVISSTLTGPGGLWDGCSYLPARPGCSADAARRESGCGDAPRRWNGSRFLPGVNAGASTPEPDEKWAQVLRRAPAPTAWRLSPTRRRQCLRHRRRRPRRGRGAAAGTTGRRRGDRC